MALLSRFSTIHSCCCCCHLPSLFWEKEFFPLAYKFKRVPIFSSSRYQGGIKYLPTNSLVDYVILIFGFLQAGFVSRSVDPSLLIWDQRSSGYQELKLPPTPGGDPGHPRRSGVVLKTAGTSGSVVFLEVSPLKSWYTDTARAEPPG